MERTSNMNRTQRFVCLVALLLLVIAIFASRTTSAADDWLPIPPEDLAMKDNPADPGAHAMILYRSSDIDSKESSVREYIRIKVFTQEGTKEGDIEIPYVKQQEDIKDIRGRTIQPDGTIVNFDGKIFEKTLVKGSGLKFLAKTFTLPDVHPGSIIEYKFREQRDSEVFFSLSWVVSGPLFTRDAKFTIKPDDSTYTLPLLYRQFGLPAGAVPVKQKNGTFTMEVHNIAGLEEEDFMPPERALQVRVDFYYKSQDDPATETELQFWNRKGKAWSEQLDHFVSKKGALESDLSRTISPNDTPDQKLRKIYARVQTIRNLSLEGSKSEKEQKQEQIKLNSNVEDLLKHNYGTARHLNYTFVGLVRTAGFSASEVLVAPRNSNFFNPEMQDPSQLGADLVWVHAGTQDYYLDPSASTYPFGILPWYETSTRGIRYTKDGGEIVTIPAAPPSQGTIIRNAELTIDSDGQATGKLQVDFTGRLGAARRERDHAEDANGRSKTIGDEIKEWLPSGSTFDVTAITNWDNNELPAHVEGIVKIPALGTAAGRRMLVPASAFQARQPASFQPEKRHYSIYFSTPYEEIDNVKFTAPEGYKFEAVPPAKQLKPGTLSYEISATQEGKVVDVKRHLVIDGLIFPVKNYPALRNFFNLVKTNDEAQIVLQSTESAKAN
jgi:hypothetical protein